MKKVKLTGLVCLLMSVTAPAFANAKILTQNADEFIAALSNKVGFELEAQDDFQANLENICTGSTLGNAMSGILDIYSEIAYGDDPKLEGYEIIFKEDRVRVRILRRFDLAVSNVEVSYESLICR